jgi:acetyl-CoA carboxylase biotin carboxyl carrier protein
MASAKKAIKPSAKKVVAPTKVAAPKKATTPKASTPKAAAPKAVSKSVDVSPKPVFNIEEITELMKAVNHSNVNELKLEKGDFKITIKQGGVVVASAPTQTLQVQQTAQAPVTSAPAPVATAPAPEPVVEVASDNLITIKSPMIGTFYRSSGPGKPLFVNVGDEIKTGQVLCIVEAMKLFNEIESEISGKIVKVLIDDATPVEYDQPLFLVQP